ncbi:TetR family transcriptional regulator [Bifidobacterium margollesii]|uniref:TetR family transcriptional regulator n=2 Tax=Bifidobacterium margollesii TaxID=2020964 RepID=A0A2N5JCG2_9BIFI|nr:TetR family transcriptional regulator [Bifidobacterium margollesii]
MDPHKRRAQIIEVASELMAERGYWGTSLQEVADACGLTVAGLIHHVQSKTGLLMMILEQEDNQSLIDIARQLMVETNGDADGRADKGEGDAEDVERYADGSSGRTVVEPRPDMSGSDGLFKGFAPVSPAFEQLSLARACEVLVAYNARNPEKVRLYSILDAEALDSSHPAYEWLKERERITLDMLERLASKETDDPRNCARMVLSLMDGLQLQWLRDSEHLDFERMWKDVTSSIPLLRAERE